METANPHNLLAGPRKLENVRVLFCERCYNLPLQSDEVQRGVNRKAGPMRADSDPTEFFFFFRRPFPARADRLKFFTLNRKTVSCSRTWACFERVNFGYRQIIIRQRKAKT